MGDRAAEHAERLGDILYGSPLKCMLMAAPMISGVRIRSNPGFAASPVLHALRAYCCAVPPARRLRPFLITPWAHPFLHTAASILPMTALFPPLSLRMPETASAARMCLQ